MPEPYDTIQRVDLGAGSMTLDELQRARRILLDDWGPGTRGDVAAARRKVEARIADLTGRPATTTPTTRRDRGPRDKTRSGAEILGLLVMLGIVGAIVYGYTSSDSGDTGDGQAAAATIAPTDVTFEDRRGFAWEACKTAVENELKAPGTADFPSVLSAEFRQATTDTIAVGGYVDAQNSFGAMIRSDWTCSATFAPGTTDIESATVISLSSR